MTTKELRDRIKVEKTGYGTFKVTDTKTGHTGITHNTLAIDRIDSDEDTPAKAVECGYTLKEAYMALYNETKTRRP